MKPLFEKQFTVYAVARRGRGESGSTDDRSVEDESGGIPAVIQSIEDGPVLARCCT